MKLRTAIFFLLLCAALQHVSAQKFTASVDKNTVSTGDQFEVSFSMQGIDGNFTPPSFNDFQVVGNSQSSSSGYGPNSMTISFILIAIKPGQFTIGPATLESHGHKLTTKPIQIKVEKGSAAPRNSAPQNVTGEPAPQLNQSNIAKYVFIRAVPDKTNLYVGQQVVLTYKIYTRLDLMQAQAANAPEFNGFWNDDITPNQRQLAPSGIETYNGKRYQVYEVRKFALFPERAGDLPVDSYAVQLVVGVPVQDDDPFGIGFADEQQVTYTSKSAPITLHVKPLPAAGQPDSFTGAVGNFRIESAADKTELKANEALNYKIIVSGKGNMKLIKPLNANFPPGFEKYDPKITDTITNGENGESGSRIYSYLLIPRQQGDFDIPAQKFAYFNPATNRYVTLSTQSVHIKVDKGTSQRNVTDLSDADKQDVKMLSRDIRYIKTGDTSLSKNDNLFFGSLLYWLLFLAGPLVCGGAYIYRNKLIEQNSDLVKVKSRRAGKIAAKHLANAQKDLVAGNASAFYENVFTGLYGYLSDKLNIQYAELNKERIVAALQAKKVTGEVITKLMDTLDLCEMARYAPVKHISQQEVFEKAKGIIHDIEDEI